MTASSKVDEIWTTRAGREIPVGEMSEKHVRNALRLLLHRKRQRVEKMLQQLDEIAGFHEDDGQEELNAQAHRDLANPNVYFPLLEGGVHGSPDLQKRYGGKL